jgi:PKD repeat protein
VLPADVVPNEIKMPGTQPEDGIVPLDEVGVCANCHGGYDTNAEPLFNWRGSMMSHSARDPIFWATLAVAEQHFDGAGDLCTRCHNPGGWLEGRSTPTDGSALSNETDRDGIECDHCHRLSNPDQSEHIGVQFDPFLAFTGDPPEGHYGSAQYVLMQDNATKMGPYDSPADANPPPGAHQALKSQFHRSPELCGTCHDVSNPVTGDLAHNNGAQVPLEVGTFSGVLGTDVTTKAAFNNPPYKYGVVERTYSEHKASLLDDTLVKDYATLPADLQAGAIKRAFDAAQTAGRGGDYADGTPRYFSCQTCHMAPVTGKGAGNPPTGRFAPPVRSDLPKHDLTGGNYWMPEAIRYLDGRGKLRLGGDLTVAEIAAMDAGALRARAALEAAASLIVEGDLVKVINLTGHKLISGYPEGRRMWLNVKWYDANATLLEEDGAYGDLEVHIDGQPTTVRTLLDRNMPVYEVHGAITQEWANQLLDLGYEPGLVIEYDPVTGDPRVTLQDVADLEPGKYHESLHFVLNNHVSYDTRIPPYGYSYDEAQRRNALPVPADQYGNPGAGGTYAYWDEVQLTPPELAATAEIRLLYQPTSWEYVQFLYLANHRQNPFLAGTGADYLEAWLNTGMAEPHVMAMATWTAGATVNAPPEASFSLICTDLACDFDGTSSTDSDGVITDYAWDFGDGTAGAGDIVSHSYAAEGTYEVTLTVTDDSGASASVTQAVTVTAPVTNVAPTASFTFTCADLACSFDGTSSSDSDGTITNWAWNFGDGASATGDIVDHTYGAAGTYTVTLTVTDDAGATASVSQDVTVNAPVPGPGPGPRRR